MLPNCFILHPEAAKDLIQLELLDPRFVSQSETLSTQGNVESLVRRVDSKALTGGAEQVEPITHRHLAIKAREL